MEENLQKSFSKKIGQKSLTCAEASPVAYKSRSLEVVWGHNEEAWNFTLEQGELKSHSLKKPKKSKVAQCLI